MKNIDDLSKELMQFNHRHNRFKEIFNSFQKSMEHLSSQTFPVKDIAHENISPEITRISFIGRDYEAIYSSGTIKGTFKGKISFLRMFSETDKKEIAAITYDGQSVVDIDPPEGEDPIELNEDECCLNLILNWLAKEINA